MLDSYRFQEFQGYFHTVLSFSSRKIVLDNLVKTQFPFPFVWKQLFTEEICTQWKKGLVSGTYSLAC